MTISKRFVSFKNIPAERYVPYKDRHASIHAHNIEELKKRHKVEKRIIEKEERQKRTEQFIKEKKLEAAITNHFKLLNII